MAEALERVAELLAEHETSLVKCAGRVSGYSCSCGTYSDHGWTLEGAARQARRHVARALATAGLVASEEQWSVVYDGGDFDPAHLPGPSDVDAYNSRAEAEAILRHASRGYITIRRGVTPWRAVDDEVGG